MYKVVVDVSPRKIPDTDGCHKYVFNSYERKREAVAVADQINQSKELGIATVEKSKF